MPRRPSLALVPLIVLASLLPGGCVPGAPAAPEAPHIVDRPISFSEERVAMTREYIESHYGIRASGIEITPRMVVLHWTAIDDAERSFRAFDRETLAQRPDLSAAGQVNVSIHFLVDRDGTIHRLMPETWMARHVIGLNYDAIGVENVGGEGGVDNLTEAQVAANARLVRYLARKYPTIEYLIGHSEYRAFEGHPLWRERDPGYRTAKIDPGERFMRAVRARVAELGLKGPPGKTRATALKPRIVPHAAWEAEPPTGHAADAARRNLAPGDSLRFRDLTITVREMRVAGAGAAGAVDDAVLVLRRGDRHAERVVPEGAALNWGGHHIAVLAVHAREGELGAGLTEMEVATLASLPPEIAAAGTAGDASYRLRVPHEIRMITLHHSGSAQPLRPDDDPVKKLRGLQSWGRADRSWWDVPYHYLIDLEGNVYEGRDHRYMGETNTAYDPHGHLLISVLGNYDLQRPTPAQIEAVAQLMAWAVAEFEVPLERIHGHGELAETSCPGEHLRAYLDDGTLLDGVRARLAGAEAG